jgi:hypothetical protein
MNDEPEGIWREEVVAYQLVASHEGLSSMMID